MESKKKFNYINHSIPLEWRRTIFSSYDAMIDCIGDGRVVEDVLMIDFISFTYDPKTEVYCLEAEIEEDGERLTAKFDCPRYAFGQLCRDILSIGDCTHLITTAHQVDGKLSSILVTDPDTLDSHYVPNTENIAHLNEILKNVWKIKRTKNTRTSNVYILRTFDFATASADGDGRAIVTGKYIHKPDVEVMKLVKKEVEKVNEDIQFVKGHATALLTRASFVDINPRVVGDKEVLLGVSCANSEFKYSALHLNGYLYIPKYDIELVGKTAQLTISLKHVGDKQEFENMLKKGVETVLGLDTSLVNLFDRITTCESRSVAISFESVDDKGKSILGTELGMSSKIKQLLKINQEKGYPKNIEGVTLTLMDYSTHHTQDENERDRVNETIMRILNRPDSFVASVGERISRANAIEIEDSIEEDNTLVKWI